MLIPTRPVDGRTVEMVFVGQARFRCTPPDEIEAGQIELFTGRRFLDGPVEEAVLVLADQERVDELLGRPPPPELPAEVLVRAGEFHRDWLGKPERRNTGVESAIFRWLAGDAAFRRYFAVWARSHELGDFVYQLDPEDLEQLTVASFVPLQVTGWDLVRLRREIRSQQRKGRWLGVRVEDLGAWDIWLSAPWSPDSERPSAGTVGFETEQYTLDITVRRRDLRLEGRAQLRLKTLAGGRLAVPLELYRDLEVRRVTDGQRSRSVPLPLRPRGRGAARRALPGRGRNCSSTSSTAGTRCAGSPAAPSTWRTPAPGTRTAAASTGRRYDVTLRWPRKYELIASGKLVDGGRQLKYRWERRVLDLPSIAFSFVLGDFVVERRRSGGTELVVAFNRHSAWRQTARERERVLETLDRSLQFFEELFGPYPLDQLHRRHAASRLLAELRGLHHADRLRGAPRPAPQRERDDLVPGQHHRPRDGPPVVGQPGRLVELPRPVAQRGDGQLRGAALLRRRGGPRGRLAGRPLGRLARLADPDDRGGSHHRVAGPGGAGRPAQLQRGQQRLPADRLSQGRGRAGHAGPRGGRGALPRDAARAGRRGGEPRADHRGFPQRDGAHVGDRSGAVRAAVHLRHRNPADLLRLRDRPRPNGGGWVLRGEAQPARSSRAGTCASPRGETGQWDLRREFRRAGGGRIRRADGAVPGRGERRGAGAGGAGRRAERKDGAAHRAALPATGRGTRSRSTFEREPSELQAGSRAARSWPGSTRRSRTRAGSPATPP